MFVLQWVKVLRKADNSRDSGEKDQVKTSCNFLVTYSFSRFIAINKVCFFLLALYFYTLLSRHLECLLVVVSCLRLRHSDIHGLLKLFYNCIRFALIINSYVDACIIQVYLPIVYVCFRYTARSADNKVSRMNKTRIFYGIHSCFRQITFRILNRQIC